MSYIDLSDPNAVEVNIGFANLFGIVGDQSLDWVRQTSAGRSCFKNFSQLCSQYGIDIGIEFSRGT